MEHQDELLEEHDLTNVLNQLPTHALEDFFSGKLLKQYVYLKQIY